MRVQILEILVYKLRAVPKSDNALSQESLSWLINTEFICESWIVSDLFKFIKLRSLNNGGFNCNLFIIIAMQFEKDIKLYEYIIERQKRQLQQIKPFNSATAFLTHVLFKAIVILMYYFQAIFVSLTSDLLTQQLNVLFVIIDFWFTKNINGRRLLGVRWFFSEDEQGIERFMFQTRINDEYLFWVIMIVYIIVPIVEISTTILIAPNLYRISYPNVIVNVVIIAGGVSNLFLFYKANSAATDRRMEFKKQLGAEFLRKLGPNSIVSSL